MDPRGAREPRSLPHEPWQPAKEPPDRLAANQAHPNAAQEGRDPGRAQEHRYNKKRFVYWFSLVFFI